MFKPHATRKRRPSFRAFRSIHARPEKFAAHCWPQRLPCDRLAGALVEGGAPFRRVGARSSARMSAYSSPAGRAFLAARSRHILGNGNGAMADVRCRGNRDAHTTGFVGAARYCSPHGTA